MTWARDGKSVCCTKVNRSVAAAASSCTVRAAKMGARFAPKYRLRVITLTGLDCSASALARVGAKGPTGPGGEENDHAQVHQDYRSRRAIMPPLLPWGATRNPSVPGYDDDAPLSISTSRQGVRQIFGGVDRREKEPRRRQG